MHASQSHPHHFRSSARDVAANLRARVAGPLPPLPRVDGLIYGAIFAIAALGLGGLSAGLWWVTRPPAPERMSEMRIGAEKLVFPASLKGPRAADMGREVGLARLRVSWPELQLPRAGEAAEIHITVGPADASTDPRAQFATLARFLTPGAWSNPGGLVTRSFKKGSPFDGDELFLSLPDGERFFARCMADVGPNRADEGCRAVLKHGPLDITLRFPREALSEWEALSEGVRRLVDGFRRPA